ncbi:hypothetical protein GLAREA_07958 [Glarea lozoyensis ATCC 20868]|uniref:Uncharacterized protein n=1 Tax=Glarea lozoyensis (strain ATCC 20868 / MF5171) TaxID=1116229 RepID=S3DBS1_GLAL2|nr:uncharacterized protein GLAREA_07958 [Glarea lozoyensis ATCC 20868]EPE24108.1 hypothetical protein GLAREA_07958 [Glarea lozoyensis ATCC 20868]
MSTASQASEGVLVTQEPAGFNFFVSCVTKVQHAPPAPLQSRIVQRLKPSQTLTPPKTLGSLVKRYQQPHLSCQTDENWLTRTSPVGKKPLESYHAPSPSVVDDLTKESVIHHEYLTLFQPLLVPTCKFRSQDSKSHERPEQEGQKPLTNEGLQCQWMAYRLAAQRFNQKIQNASLANPTAFAFTVKVFSEPDPPIIPSYE